MDTTKLKVGQNVHLQSGKWLHPATVLEVTEKEIKFVIPERIDASVPDCVFSMCHQSDGVDRQLFVCETQQYTPDELNELVENTTREMAAARKKQEERAPILYTIVDVEAEWAMGDCFFDISTAYLNIKNAADYIMAVENGVQRRLNAEEQAIFDECHRNTQWSWKTR